jgi:hypothetical protein
MSAKPFEGTAETIPLSSQLNKSQLHRWSSTFRKGIKMKKLWATAAVAASIVGASVVVASPAMAIGDDSGTTSFSGNGAEQSFGNSSTHGDMSPQLGLVQGSLNKPCIGLPAKANVGSLVALVNVAVQDINVLSSPQNQQCVENSTQAKGDEPLSHILEDIPILSANGKGNG